MVNKIDNMSSSPVRRIEARSADARPATSTEAAPARAKAQPGKTLMEQASERARSSPEVNNVRVGEVKAAIARGEFTIDPKAVARAFIRMESA